MDLIELVKSKNYDKARELLNDPSVDVNMQDDYGNSPLLLAVLNNDVEMISILFERKDLNVNNQNHLGYSALILASTKGCVDAVKMLLSRDDVSVNLFDNDGSASIHQKSEAKRS